MKNNQINPKRTISLKVLSGFITAISRIITSFGLDFPSFSNSLKIQVVLNSNKKTKGIVNTSIATGIDRRQVSAIINNNYRKLNLKTESYEIRILERIRAASVLYKDQTIPKYGDLNCINSILKRCGCSHIKMNVFIKILVERGSIDDLGDSIRYKGFHFRNKQKDEVFLTLISRCFNRYSNTLIFNKETPKETLGCFEKTIFSTQIPTEQQEEVNKHLYLMCREFHAKVADYLESKETAAPGSYQEVGLSTYQLNTKSGDENE